MVSRDDTGTAANEDGERRRARPAPALPIDDVTEASAESFPASDSPPWSGMRAGPPDRDYSAPAPTVRPATN
jgi:hypothetical protein